MNHNYDNLPAVLNATQLATALGISRAGAYQLLHIKPNKLTQHLNVQAGRLKNEYGIHYESCRTHSGRSIKLRPA